MSLVRIKPRRTINIGNLSFADGEVSLIHYEDVPLGVRDHALKCVIGILDYYEFCWEDGVIEDHDLSFLTELSAEEHIELIEQVADKSGMQIGDILNVEVSVTEVDPDDADFGGLSPEQEAEVDRFSDFLRGLSTRSSEHDPEDDDDDDDGEGNGLSVV